MGLITAIRAQMPTVEAVAPAAPSDQRADQRQPQGRIRPVSQPELPDATQQVPARPAAMQPHLLAAREGTESAAATAEAARSAYIRASIAAGLSPLPLP